MVTFVQIGIAVLAIGVALLSPPPILTGNSRPCGLLYTALTNSVCQHIPPSNPKPEEYQFLPPPVEGEGGRRAWGEVENVLI
jgi:hypothetical protein